MKMGEIKGGEVVQLLLILGRFKSDLNLFEASLKIKLVQHAITTDQTLRLPCREINN